MTIPVTILSSAAFAELKQIAAISDTEYPHLKTAMIAEDRKASQFRRIASIGKSSIETIYLHNDCFISRFQCEEDFFLALKTEGLTEAELEDTSSLLAGYGLFEHELEECFFLFLRHSLKRLYKVKRERRDAMRSKDILAISSAPGYAGHDILDLIEYHEDIQVFKIDQNSIFSNLELWGVAATIASNLTPYRSALIPTDSALQIASISSAIPSLSENVYTALTSIHWKYTFFELYKCIEALFFLPWGLSTKTGLQLNSSAFDSHQLITTIMSFKTKEKDSIEKLFMLLDDQFVADAKNSNIESFKELDLDASTGKVNTSKQLIGRRIYKIRNTLVHQEDFEDRSPLALENENWSNLVKFLCSSIIYLYTTYSSELPKPKPVPALQL